VKRHSGVQVRARSPAGGYSVPTETGTQGISTAKTDDDEGQKEAQVNLVASFEQMVPVSRGLSGVLLIKGTSPIGSLKSGKG